MPRPCKPELAASALAASAINRLSVSSRNGAGATSISFWCRRCNEHSRSKSVATAPQLSAATCTSTWRADHT